MIRFVTATLLIVGATPAWAQTRPNSFPTRDVTVTYHTQNGRDATMAFSAAARRVRVSGVATNGSYAIIERDGGQMFMVMPEKRSAMMVPETPEMRSAMTMQSLSGFTRAGSATVARVSCTVWGVDSSKGAGDVCITGDGVLLRARRTEASGTKETVMEATKVDYQPLPASEFEVPSGYQTTTVPAMPQAPGMPAKPKP